MVSERQKEILTCVVNNFIDTAQPMSSKMVLDHLSIQLSSATIRQIFSKLDHQGYLAKLHTSSGRIPTDKGYRLFVDDFSPRMDQSISLDACVGEQTVIQKFEDLFHVMLSNISHQLPYIPVLIYRSQVISDIECLKYVPIHSTVGLLLAYHKVGVVSEYYIKFEKSLDVSQPDDLIEWVLSQLKSSEALNLNQAKLLFSGDDYLFVESICRSLSTKEPSQVGNYEFLYRNFHKCIQLPDFSDKESIQNLLNSLDKSHSIVRLLNLTIDQEKLSVFIGSEIGDKRLSGCSLIGIPIILDGVTIASLGILGPIRMDYQLVMSILTSGKKLAEFIQV